MQLNTLDIQNALHDTPFFIGVFPKDQLPLAATATKNLTFVVNTDASNLPGQHWIAVFVRDKTTAYVFDPFGQSPPLKLQSWFNNRNIEWTCNLRCVQPLNSELCGAYCIYFLWFATTSQFRDEHFENIMNILFPRLHTYSTYESIVRSFMNSVYPDLML